MEGKLFKIKIVIQRIYDVSSKKEMYSKPSSYYIFAGKDATRCFAVRLSLIK
jgi:hypothetical protein